MAPIRSVPDNGSRGAGEEREFFDVADDLAGALDDFDP
jgi:hypothetical protein